ncbi:S8 family serine peptidase [Croceicoccus naphthovorans]|uniref:Peptidase S8/S53 domain-containing protein n=1 Tax=Croceicoccus naphthovorans TaxID=1348774 RepID=A0A0G3XC02_9SPHN|nr:S8 family serine peptidase [Croceicoccus naphthovorans]AKM09055.1 hypothetical protein AB433_02260 [Croceicoccus naphthovorans]MBB3991439.1 regulator of extracellular matrix RemA (YlzA/DUF370 family) [Croceicoccus naphthovorans]
MRKILLTVPLVLILIASPALAGLGGVLPGVGQTLDGSLDGLGGGGDSLGGVLDPVTGTLDDVRDGLDDLTARTRRTAERLVRNRTDRLRDLVRDNSAVLAFDNTGHPARRDALLALDVDAAGFEALRKAGFDPIGTETVEGLDLTITRIAVPDGMTLAQAQDRLAEQVPDIKVSSDALHFTAGAPGMATAVAVAADPKASVPVGMIDGAVGGGIGIDAQRGFAEGAPIASDHGSAVASLLKSAGVASVRVADVYGTDPGGGNALAIARGLGWLVKGGSRVVTISLVGPENPVLSRAIASAQRQGVVVVAAVGNDGPAAPPSYPASYNGVVAVTAVDRHDRALIEAGRATHLDYAAPGADIYGTDRRGKRMRLRGTSFATPLAAARIASVLAKGGSWRAKLDEEARDLGPKGNDATYGRGLVCDKCAGRR